jgi:hypothetical protein
MEFGNHGLFRNEYRQTVEVAVEPLGLAHDVAREFHKSTEEWAVVGAELEVLIE